MKIGLLTFFESNNYGTVLQAYALQRYLEELGHQVELIHIKRNVSTASKHFKIQEFSYSVPEKLCIRLGSIGSEKREENKTKRFRKFRESYLHVSPVYYETEEQLFNNPPHCDLYLSGGDQIWNPYHKVFSTHFMWDFLPDDSKIVSYASSFGVDKIEDKEILAEMQKWLRRYSKICVREQSGVKIVESMRLCATQVLDPVFLIRENWKELISQSATKQKYCLVYALIGYPKDEDVAISKYAKEHGLEVKILPYNRRNCLNRYTKEFETDPAEFLWLIANAEFIFTNSFHGMAFSLIFNKQFQLISAASDEGNSKRDRLMDLLKRLDIQDSSRIDYEVINEKLDKMIEESGEILKQICDEEK